MRNHPSRAAGVTLIELMIAVAVVAILASIAVPSYRQYVTRSKRSAAQSAMMDIANREQQFLLANRRYATKAGLEGNGYALPGEVGDSYTWDVEVPDDPVPYFTIKLTPLPNGSQASDAELTLDSSGKKTPADKWRR
jgi:type IV pilus assembly protein PilE